jgi:hypothetical protein
MHIVSIFGFEGTKSARVVWRVSRRVLLLHCRMSRFNPELLGYVVLLATTVSGLLGTPWWTPILAATVMSVLRARMLWGRAVEVEQDWRERRRGRHLVSWPLVFAASFLTHLALGTLCYLVGRGLPWALGIR